MDPRRSAPPADTSPADGTGADAPAAVPPDGAARVAADLRAALGPLFRRLRQVRPGGELTLAQTSVLVRLDREGPASATELASGEGITPQSMGTIVAALLQRGLVARAADPGDGRRMVLSLTDAGREGLLGLRRERAQRLAYAMEAELTPVELEQLAVAIPLLERITRHV